jgi:two-component system, OmpR family, sensor kinase
MRRRRVTLRTRLLVGLLVVMVVVVVAFDLATVTALRYFLLQRTDGILNHAVQAYRSQAAELVVNAERRQLAAKAPQAFPGEYYLAIVTADRGTVVIAASPDAPPRLPPDLTELARSGRIRTVKGTDGTTRFRVRAVETEVGVLVAAVNLDSVTAIVDHLGRLLAVGTAVALGVLAAGGLVVLRRGLRPLESMAAQADRITAGDLSHRVAPQTPDTEVGRLGLALNRMLGRIEAAVGEQRAGQERMRRFFADASHELRTPLTSLRANAELYQQGALVGRGQVYEAMRRIRVSAERMSALVDDMLRLARLGQQPERRMHAVDVSAVVADCVREARAVDDGRRWTSGIQPGLVVRGDPDLLRRGVDNLLRNVRTHTPAGTTGTVTAYSHHDRVVIEVRDDGPGVPQRALPQLFDRFYRVDGPSTGGGSGLGLAIVAEVAAAHGGTATADANAPRGLRIRLALPQAAPRNVPPRETHDPA